MSERQTSKVAIVGNYPPRKCGIATFTSDLRSALDGMENGWPCSVVAVTDPGGDYAYPPEVRFEIPEADAPSYLRAAEFLKVSHADVICLQHEFGIFGGPGGRYINTLLRRAGIPTVTTLHTVLAKPEPDQKRAFEELVDCSSKLVGRRCFAKSTAFQRKRPRRVGAIPRRGGDRHGGARDFRGPATPPRDEETSLPRRARNGLAGGRPGLRAGFR